MGIETFEYMNVKEIVKSKNCIVGGKDDYLFDRLKEAFRKAKKIDIIVSFLRESGVKYLKEELEGTVERKVPIRILTGNYLGITEPSALYLMKDILGDEYDMRFYSDKSRSFHPKAYIFHYDDGDGEIFIGSSNISKSALTSGLEWNYKIDKSAAKEDFEYFCNEFENLLFNESVRLTEVELENYSKNWRKPKIERMVLNDREEENVVELFEPKGAQIEALANLKKLREEEIDRGIVVASTGIGKTYLAAFDSLGYKKVLFVAHREEILNQAKQSFENIRKDFKTGFFKGDKRDLEVDGLFASVQTLGKKEYLNEKYFKEDYFDYIVIDEFHHAVNKNYINIINYFKPKFLLGITATPERMDNKDVFKICDYNVAYEIRLTEAINKGYLCPFRYYGIYDSSVNYDSVAISGGKYKSDELEKALMIDKRAELIYKHYRKYKTNQCIGFCSSKKHAEYMSRYFNDKGVKACAVYSGNGEESLDRKKAIEGLIKGDIKVIFSVDMFNEGVDIKSLDMVMFLRPTESQTIFLQQLGRGLRVDKDKKYVNVLDFIGNYKKIEMIPSLIGKGYVKGGETNPNEFEYPEDCIIDFDFEIVDIISKFINKNKKIKDIILEEYRDIKESLGHRVSRVSFIENVDSEIYTRMKGNNNPLKNYLGFLKENGELSREEEEFLDSMGHKFINYIETTAMSRTYKMPILLALYNNGEILEKIGEEEIYVAMKSFYSKGTNKADLLKSNETKDIDTWNKEKYIKKARQMPLKFLMNTGSDFFEEEGSKFGFKKEMKEWLDNEIFKENFIDAINMRVIEYYKNRK